MIKGVCLFFASHLHEGDAAEERADSGGFKTPSVGKPND